MAEGRQSILPLPLDVQAQIKSSIAIISLNQVVLELVKNALDASCRTIHIEVDYLCGGCSVEDDGQGIPAAEFAEEGHLGSMHCTSKHQPTSDTYGSHGRFLSSLSALSLLSITSSHKTGAEECSISFYLSHAISRFQTSKGHQRILATIHGTKVAVRNLFGKMPVRVKHRAIQFESQDKLDREFEDLKRRLVSLLLAWSRPTKVTLVDAEKKRKCVLRQALERHTAAQSDQGNHILLKLPFRLDWICSLLVRAGYINHHSFESWVTASARTASMSIRLALSLEPVPTKQIQFMSFGIRPVELDHSTNAFFDEINRLFAFSSFGATEVEAQIHEENDLRRETNRRLNYAEPTSRQLKGTGKGANKWPMFYLRVDLKSGDQVPRTVEAHEQNSEAGQVRETVLQLLKTLIHQFLEEHNFRPRKRRKKSPEKHQNGFRGSPLAANPIPERFNEALPFSANSTALSTHSTGHAGRSRSQRQVTSHAFDSWSRVKTSNRAGLKNILSGLPRSKIPPTISRCASAPAVTSSSHQSKVELGRTALAEPHLQNPLDRDVELLLQDLRDDSLAGETEEETATGLSKLASDNGRAPSQPEDVVISFTNTSPDGTILWTNPATRSTMRINSRTGFFMPEPRAEDPTNRQESTRSATATEIPGTSISASKLLPRSRVSMHSRNESAPRIVPDSWIGDLIRDAKSSFFPQPEKAIPTVALGETLAFGQIGACCSGKFSYCGFKEHSSISGGHLGAASGRLSKSALARADVLAQVDQKFILVKMNICPSEGENGESDPNSTTNDKVLVLIDQHAADERCRVEELYQELCQVQMTRLPKPIHFEIPTEEALLFRLNKDYFASWGFDYEMHVIATTSASRPFFQGSTSRPRSLHSGDSQRLVVTALPELIAERCRLQPKILIDLLRTEIWSRADEGNVALKAPCTDVPQGTPETSWQNRFRWLSKTSTCPKGVLDMLNSRACRSAIMFNDLLSKQECESLVRRLSQCSFPFQCAHGRPSMVALGGLDNAGKGLDGSSRESRACYDASVQVGKGSFAAAFAKWQNSEM